MKSETKFDLVGIGSLISSIRLVVPENQRSFAWEAAEADELLDDVIPHKRAERGNTFWDQSS
jgi:hypothetical protein